MVPPFRMETTSSEKIPLYAKETPTIPPFLPYRNMTTLPTYPGIEQQRIIIQAAEKKGGK
jgi:hypothetical protein